MALSFGIPGDGAFLLLEWKDHVMGSKSQVSPPRSTVREFFSSLAGMITIGLAAGLVLCSPFFIYWQRSSPETRAVSSGADPQPPTPPTQAPVKTESKQQTTAVDQFLPTPEQSTTTHNTESTNDACAVLESLGERTDRLGTQVSPVGASGGARESAQESTVPRGKGYASPHDSRGLSGIARVGDDHF